MMALLRNSSAVEAVAGLAGVPRLGQIDDDARLMVVLQTLDLAQMPGLGVPGLARKMAEAGVVDPRCGATRRCLLRSMVANLVL
jgi:hypothetical protein